MSTEKKKFKYPLAISGTKEDLEALIPKLEELGYEEGSGSSMDYDYGNKLMTNFNNPNTLGYYNTKSNNWTVVPASNPELVLALAACVYGEIYHKGEWVVYSGTLSAAKPGDLAITRNGINTNRYGEVYFDVRWPKGNSHGQNDGNYYPKDFRKATKEEIISHFEKQNMALDVTKQFSPTEIIGYKFKPGCEKFEKAALAIAGVPAFITSGLFKHDSDARVKLENAGVLNEWFEAVQEEERKKIKVRYAEGTLDVVVSKAGIDYWDVEIDPEHLQRITQFHMRVWDWETRINTVDIGCKKGIVVDDLRKVVDEYERLNK